LAAAIAAALAAATLAPLFASKAYCAATVAAA